MVLQLALHIANCHASPAESKMLATADTMIAATVATTAITIAVSTREIRSMPERREANGLVTCGYVPADNVFWTLNRRVR